MKPTLKPDLRYTLADALLAEAIKIGDLLQSCLNCENFKESTEQCMLVPKMKVPARVIAYGCPKWAPTDEVPF